jgi:hypothetical protein
VYLPRLLCSDGERCGEEAAAQGAKKGSTIHALLFAARP